MSPVIVRSELLLDMSEISLTCAHIMLTGGFHAEDLDTRLSSLGISCRV